jgi:diacylglycerol kinase
MYQDLATFYSNKGLSNAWQADSCFRVHSERPATSVALLESWFLSQYPASGYRMVTLPQSTIRFHKSWLRD